MKIYYPRHCGFCFGVKRAIKMAVEAAGAGERVYSLGPLIHNRLVVDDLKSKGIITVKNPKEIKSANVIIRSHGIHPAMLEKLQRDGYRIIDATCPKVRRAQRYVEKLTSDGYYVVIVGEKDHPEVRGLLGYGRGKAKIFHEGMRLVYKKIGVVPQTTMNIETLNFAIAQLMPAVLEMKVYNTICYETSIRINEALRIARRANLMVVVGGKNSANTTRLFQICSQSKPCYHIESADEIELSWFKGVRSIGITAGASTPREQIQEIVKYLHRRIR